MCGLPYSGKTFFSKRFSAENGYRLVSIDDVRESLGFFWGKTDTDAQNWQEVFRVVDDLIVSTLNQGESVVYDSANQDEASRSRYRKLAESLGCNSKIVFVNTSMEVIQERRLDNQGSLVRAHIPQETFESAIQTFVPPKDADVIICGVE
ncbi:MAG TPA: ATP-binding protein [Acidimicrobiales bacterium]|nr:ATP-binding protein [Acidimicrobiales bacterium]